VRRGLVILSIALLSACAGLGGLSQKPEVSVAGLKLVQVGVFEQRFILKLRVQNPNDVELRINGLSVEVELNGQPFITGLSDKGVTVPRFGEAVLEVMATSTLGSALKQLRELQKGGRERIDYRIVGRLNLSGIGTVPFERRGDLQMPAVVSPLRKPLPPGTQGT
jgi:LEA14-like dessication related protein